MCGAGAQVTLLRVLTSTTRSGGLTAVLVLIWGAWVLAPLVLAGAAVASLVTFLGEPPTAAEVASAGRLFAAAAARGCRTHPGLPMLEGQLALMADFLRMRP